MGLRDTLAAILDEARGIRRAIEGQQDRWIPWSEALRRIGGNQEDAEQLLYAAVSARRVKTLTVASSKRVRVWSPDLAHVGETPKATGRRGNQKTRFQIPR